MDRFGEWRPIEPAADEDAEKKRTPIETAKTATSGGTDIHFMGLIAAGVVLAVGGFVWFTTSKPAAGLELSGQAEFLNTGPASVRPGGGVVAAAAGQPTSVTLTVDVEGAVVVPGLHRLPAGSRVGDAIAAAGGYSSLIDISAAASGLNLAQPLTDGAKVHVPVRGEAVATTDSGGAAQPGDGSGGLINVNTASAEDLDTLPGIGPVTAAKIIAAREDAPFAAVDDLLRREVVGPATFEKLRELVTIGP
ncbi:MAG: ComEA family DNA-binding protein [Candidatus Limnocylindrales bacterium]